MPDKTDNFFQEEEKAQEELEKIKIGEAEYDAKELEGYIEKGKKVDEYTKKYNTDFDKAWSSYGKTTQENKELRVELERLKQQVQFQKGGQDGELTEEQKTQVRKSLQDILGGNIITDKELDSTLAQREAGRALLSECKSHELDIDGTDGRPKFVTADILRHMEETGIRNPMKAYKDKFESELDTWKQSELNKEKGSVLPTLSSMGTKQPKTVPVTKDNIGQLIREQLNVGEGHE
jgi:hypothetical protein